MYEFVIACWREILEIPFGDIGDVTGPNKNQGFERRDEVSEAYDLYSFDSYDHGGLAGGIWSRFVLQR